MSNREYLEKYGIDTGATPGDAFNRALSDFTHDVASGGAIRHLCDRGYTVPQIMKLLDYPTPRERVEKTFTRHLIEKGILSDRLPEGYLPTRLDRIGAEESTLLDNLGKGTSFASVQADAKTSIAIDKEDQRVRFLSCSFGRLRADKREIYDRMLALLTAEERDYIESIRWSIHPMYHRLTPGMYAIAKKLDASGMYEVEIYERNG